MRRSASRGWRRFTTAAVLLGASCLVATAGGTPAEAPARAARLWVGFSEFLSFGETVGTIIVGDAAVIDATVVDGRSVVLTALAPGRTNVIVLGQQGAALSRLTVHVRRPREPAAVLYRGTERSVLACDPRCTPATDGALGDRE